MRRLPVSHALLNLGRRPVRSALLALALALVAMLFVGTTAFVRGMRSSILQSAPDATSLLISTSATRDVVRSSVRRDVADLVRADVSGVVASSPEVHLATEIALAARPGRHGAFVRGVTEEAFDVHLDVTLIDGRLPGPGEALAGRLAHATAGLGPTDLAPGAVLEVEGGRFRVSGTFAARGSTAEGEIWVPLEELQAHAQRDDCSVVFVRTRSAEDLADVELFAHRRLDLELVAIDARTYYAEAAAYLAPLRTLAQVMAWMIGLAALLSGANAFHASVRERARELACMQALGFRGRALASSLLQEALWLGLIGIVVGTVLARLALASATFRIAMTAFALRVDAACVSTGALSVLVVVLAGVLPALVAVLRLPIARALRED